MGGVKGWLLEQQERGYRYVGDKWVCAECFCDNAIRAFIIQRAEASACSYCEREADGESIAAPLDDVLGLIVRGLEKIYRDPNDEGVLWESAEGGWQGAVLGSHDVVAENLPLPEGSDELLEDILASLQDRQWCQRGFWQLTPDEALIYGWDEFCHTVKHETRYLFTVAADRGEAHRGSEEIEPARMLGQLGRLISEAGLVHQVPIGESVLRARVHDGTEEVRRASELGPPGAESARFSNRMSPAGIPMFYGAFDAATAEAETCEPHRDAGRVLSVGRFKVARDLHVLDLSVLPPVPSIFDEDMSALRPGLIFLHEFAKDVARPIEKDGREHIEYVPTQIVTEFFRRVFTQPGAPPLDGIVYRSSRTNGACCVLFLDQSDVKDAGDADSDVPASLVLPNGAVSSRALP